MTTAIVQRPRRKAHLATWRGTEWWTVCDLVVAADATATSLEDAVGTIDRQAGAVCAHCHRLILMADAAHQLGVGRLLASLELGA